MLLTNRLLEGQMRSEGIFHSQTKDWALGTSHMTRAKEEEQACPMLALAFSVYPRVAGSSPSVV